MPLALAVVYEIITEVNKKINEEALSAVDAKKILSLWKKINTVLGLILSGQAEIPEEIKKLVAEREAARNGKDFEKSDALRKMIEEHGFILEDTKDGQKIRLAS